MKEKNRTTVPFWYPWPIFDRMARMLLFLLSFVLFQGTRGQTRVETEFRGFWIATINHIDWPQPNHFNPQHQQKEFLRILDFYESLNFNAVFVQIRPAGDAFYESKLAPWSRFLTGEEGGKMNWDEDPLRFMIKEAHKRNMEFHAWFNPFRATSNLDLASLHAKHVYYDHPDWLVRYGKRYHLDPGKPEVREYVVKVVQEVVEKYNIDGVHFDDYFYPYPETGMDFDDRKTFIRWGIKHFNNREDWRRANIDSLVYAVHNMIETTKPWLKFGISPFGVWQNKADDPRGSETSADHSNYHDLFADPLVWIENHWVDYLAPQLYWSHYHEKASYKTLALWWNAQAQDVPIYTGHALYKVGNNEDQVWQDLNEIPRQLALNKSLENIQGSIFFSAKSLQQFPRLAEKLSESFFQAWRFPSIRDNKKLDTGAPAIKTIKALRNTLFVDLEVQELDDEELSILILDNEMGSENQIIAQEKLTKNLQVQLTGERMELVLAYFNKFRQLSLQSRVIKAEKINGRWNVVVL